MLLPAGNSEVCLFSNVFIIAYFTKSPAFIKGIYIFYILKVLSVSEGGVCATSESATLLIFRALRRIHTLMDLSKI